MCGLFVWLVRKWPAAVLIPLGVALIAVASAITFAGGFSMPYWDDEALRNLSDGWNPSVEALNEDLAAYRGAWLDQMTTRPIAAAMFETFMFAIWGVWRAGGLMLVGMGLFKLGVFQASRSATFYALLALVGLSVGLALDICGVRWNEARAWDIRSSFFQGSQFNYWASLMASLGYVGVVMLACKSPAMLRRLQPLAAVGRMALTNYLIHTIICTTIFYGHGLGCYGSVERTGQVAIVVGIWIVQLILSPIWLRYFQFGPFEWLWRSLTYWKMQPFRKRDVTGGFATL